jgi:hypothetical protein
MKVTTAHLIAAAIVASADAALPSMPKEVRPTVPAPRQSGRGFILCFDCGHGGGTLLNADRDGEKVKVHKKGHCVRGYRRA